jgi:hypothetical protein
MFLIATIITGFVILFNEIDLKKKETQNTPPTSPVVIISPSPTYDDDLLTCMIILPSTDAENDTITYQYSWAYNGIVTDLESPTVSANETKTGDIWQCFVTPYDGQEYGEFGSDTTIIQKRETSEPKNTPPSTPTVVIEPKPAYSNNSLTCTITVPSIDIDNDTIIYQYDWFRNQSITGLTGSILSTIHTKKGEEWECRVTPFDGKDYGQIGKDSVIIQDDDIPLPENTPPSAPEVSIEPHPANNNNSLTCIILVQSTDVENDSITYIYEWFKDGNPINESGQTIDSNQTKIGEEWKCVVTPFDGIEYGEVGIDTIIIRVEASGIYTLNPTISYYCAFGLVDLSYSSFTFIDTGTTLTIQPMMNGGGYMMGNTASFGTIDVSFTYFGSCDEIYSLEGTFINENSWQATFTVSFVGSCFDCISHSWQVTGTRV